MTTPTPQSDQAATTPDVLKLLSDFTNKHYAMAADEYREGYPGPSVRRRYDESVAAEYALINALRAQSAELLALRADKQRMDWLENVLCYVMICPDGEHAMRSLPSSGRGWTNGQLRAAIDAALNSPTQGEKSCT